LRRPFSVSGARLQADQTERDTVLRWAKSHAIPLSRTMSEAELSLFGALIGDASIVALSEALHGVAEPLLFRNRVLEYLVRNKGFTAIAIESGVLEGRRVNDFVHGSADDRDTVLAEGLSWRFGDLPQNRELIEWLRQYNAASGCSRAVNFYGFDLPGSPGLPDVCRGIDTALREVICYLRAVDSAAVEAFDRRAGALLRSVRFDLCAAAEQPSYDKLSSSERDTLTASIGDVIAQLERCAEKYSALTTPEEYEWAHRAAIAARQVDAWLRQLPLNWRPARAPIRFPSPQTEFLVTANDVRDLAQADNLEWILSREGERGKLVVFGHRYHISAAPVRADWTGGCQQAVMGTHLRRRWGSRLITIGNLVQGGPSMQPASPKSVDGLINGVGPDHLLLDLRQAPAELGPWLASEQALSQIPLGEGHDGVSLSVGKAFDILHFIRAVTPA
jgi:erythromycin esterase